MCLVQIWTFADVENRGFLIQPDFARALRLIGHYQANPGRPLHPDLALSRSYSRVVSALIWSTDYPIQLLPSQSLLE